MTKYKEQRQGEVGVIMYLCSKQNPRIPKTNVW